MLRSTAVISLLFLISCPSAFAGGRHGFSIKVFTSPDDQFWTNSVIIEGEHEVMLVDPQLTKLLVFEEELKKAKDPDSFINTMKERFPSADLLLALERGAKANVKP